MLSKEIPTLKGFWLVGDDCVWNVWDNWQNSWCGIYSFFPGGKDKEYKKVRLWISEEKKYKDFLLHRLLVITFKSPEPFPGAIVRHLDDVGINNRLENLVWGTRQQNTEDAVRNGINQFGENGPRSKLKEEDVLEIRRRIFLGESQLKIATDYSVSPSTVCDIKHRRTWSSLL